MTLDPSKINTRAVEEAFEQAEGELNPPRPDLFRVPDLDMEYVENLAARIVRNDSIDPPLVMKIGGEWVCVDGHHRIAAHRKLGSHGVRSEWFDGAVREAANEQLRHLRRNRAAVHPTQQGLNTATAAEEEAAKAARARLLKALRHPLLSVVRAVSAEDVRARLLNTFRRPPLSVVRAVSVQQGSSTAEDRTRVDADVAQTGWSPCCRIVSRRPHKPGWLRIPRSRSSPAIVAGDMAKRRQRPCRTRCRSPAVGI
jgi:hypothetical protein